MSIVGKNELIILASSSPRRKELLKQLGVVFKVYPARVDESLKRGEFAKEFVLRISYDKGRHVAEKFPDKWVLAADTVVVIDSNILGKPSNRKEAKEMLKLINGKYHTVYTGFALINLKEGKVGRKVVGTEVKIKHLTNQELEGYLDTGEPYDKAGAYAIQGIGSFLVEKISGSYSNVVGLPVAEIVEAFKKYNAYNIFKKWELRRT